MFGNGIYLANRSSKSVNYCAVGRAGYPGMLFVVEAALGKSYVATTAKGFNNPPRGYDSVCGRAGHTKAWAAFTLQNDEYVVYRPEQQTIRYLVTFAWALINLSVPVFSVVQLSYRLPLIPDELQGRVNSSYRFMAWGTQPLGSALAGFLLENTGSVITVAVVGSILLLVAAATTLNREVRYATRSMPPEPAAPAERG
jgi:hypothetical protein